ncbi:zinc-binding dehydrogenase [Propioniciclava sp.]|uniref:zinc-binding dehydrogenase n=1 Tax=Propioniciclava sp. TaxID=2038686 RepID=UPI002616B051|nr:zinc-binding dehydrogenase [Propioniciclava sp.]
MRAAFVRQANPTDPLAALEVGERPEPDAAPGWVTIAVRAASLNHHDLWSLRGVGLPPERMPMILGTDAVGVTPDGRAVIAHAVVASEDWTGDETLDPKRALYSEGPQGTLAERLAVPERNLVDKPEWLTWEEASCLPCAWLTAWRMLTKNVGLHGPGTVLVQGSSGGVNSAAIALAHALGHRVWVTARSEAKRVWAAGLGADATFEPGSRLPERVDAVIDNVGEATWSHSLKSLRPGGTVVTCGATSGSNPPADLSRVFFLQLRVIGSTMGTRAELVELLGFLEATGLRPHVDRVLPLSDVGAGLAALASGEVFGKVVIRP